MVQCVPHGAPPRLRADPTAPAVWGAPPAFALLARSMRGVWAGRVAVRVVPMSVWVLRGVRLLCPRSGLDEEGDLVLEGGRIARRGRGAASGISGEGVREVDCRGLWALPGLVDMHVHLREPGAEAKETIASGLRAAAAGGFTTVAAMPNTDPTADRAPILRAMQARAAAVGASRLLCFGAMTQERQGTALAPYAELCEAGAIGVSDDGSCVTDGGVMRRVMQYAHSLDLLVSQHAEDHAITRGAPVHEGAVAERLGLRGWPAEAEACIVARDLVLAEATGARYHVAHVSTASSVRLLREAKDRGLAVSAEVTPHHLTLTDEAVLGYRTDCKVNPPLRSAEHVEAVREALRDGTIDCVATDHAPHAPRDKDAAFEEAPFGINGFETALSVLLQLVRDGTLTPLRLAEVCSTVPARLLRLSDGEGSLRPGARADVTLLDPEASWRPTPGAFHSRSCNSPWLGQPLRGRVVGTWVAGHRVHALD